MYDRVDVFLRIVAENAHRWSHEWDLEQITCWQYFGNARNSASSRSIARFCTADAVCTPSISGFDTAGTACARGYVLLILPVLPVSTLVYSGLCIINTSYQKLPFGSGDDPDKLLFHQALN